MAELWTFNPRKRHKIAPCEPFDLRKRPVNWSIVDPGRSQAARVLRAWPGPLKADIRRHDSLAGQGRWVRRMLPTAGSAWRRGPSRLGATWGPVRLDLTVEAATRLGPDSYE